MRLKFIKSSTRFQVKREGQLWSVYDGFQQESTRYAYHKKRDARSHVRELNKFEERVGFDV